MIRVALVVPEYRTGPARGGGVAAVADFLATAFESDPAFRVEIVSPRMHHAAPENRRLLSPRTWLRGPSRSSAVVDGRTVTYIGSDWAEFEPARFRPRPLVRQFVSGFDVVVVVAGSPAIAAIVGQVERPMALQVATLVATERAHRLRRPSGPRTWWTRLVTAAVAAADERGLAAADLVITENAWMTAEVERRQHPRVVLQAPGVDVDAFVPSDAHVLGDAPASPGSAPYVLCVGRLNDSRKDHVGLLRAFRLATDDHGLTQRLVIAGRHAPLPETVAEVIRLGLGDRVSIVSDPTADELRRLYRDADLFALASAEEGLGIVLLEAMASGLPVLTTATEGASHVVVDGVTGTIIPFGAGLDARMAREMARYGAAPSLRHAAGAAGRQRAVDDFSVDVTGQRFRSLVSSLFGAQSDGHSDGGEHR